MQGLPGQDGLRAFVRAEPRGSQVPDTATIHAFFEQYGEVNDVYSPVRTPDICYVTFRQVQSLDQLLNDAAGGILMIGEQGCTITRALPRGSQSGSAIPAASAVLDAAGGLDARMNDALAATLAAGSGSWGQQGGQSLSESSTRIYVTGPVQQLGDEALRAHFGQFGLVRDVYIPVDHASGLQKPFAFVTMNTAEEQQMVLALPMHQLTEDLCVNVTYAAPRSGGKGGDAGGGGFSNGGGFAGGGFGGVSAESLLQDLTGGLGAAQLAALGIKAGGFSGGPGGATNVSGPPGSANGPKQGVPGDHRIFVLGMPDGLNGDMLRGHFARHGEILDIYIPVRTPDLAYITFGTEFEMQDALLNSGLSVAGFQVNEIKQAAPKEQGGKGGGRRARPY